MNLEIQYLIVSWFFFYLPIHTLLFIKNQIELILSSYNSGLRWKWVLANIDSWWNCDISQKVAFIECFTLNLFQWRLKFDFCKWLTAVKCSLLDCDDGRWNGYHSKRQAALKNTLAYFSWSGMNCNMRKWFTITKSITSNAF